MDAEYGPTEITEITMPPRALFNLDMRGPSIEADCFDPVVALPVAIERMREMRDDYDLPMTLLKAMRASFDVLDHPAHEGLTLVALSAQDLLYRYIAELSILDRFTRVAFRHVARGFFQCLTAHGIQTFYILDNALREDRLQAVLELFDLAGIAVTTPARDGLEWTRLEERIRAGLDGLGHAAYVEPDAQVNHLESAKQLAQKLPCVATFRHLGPEHPEQEILNLGRAGS